MNLRRTATLSGWLWIITFATSIPAYLFLYAPMREDPGLITGAGADPTISLALGAILEIILIIANVGTAVVFYPILSCPSASTSSSRASSRRPSPLDWSHRRT